MTQLTQIQRLQIVQLHSTLKCNLQVAKRLGVSRKTVSKWTKHFKEHQNVDRKVPRGDRKVMDSQAAKLALDMMLSNEYDNVHSVAKQLQSEGRTRNNCLPHRTTVTRHAKAAALAEGTRITAVACKPGKQLTMDTKAKRVDFCVKNKSTNWSRVMFTDRKKFYFQYPGKRVRRVQWIKKGEARTSFKPNHPSGLNVYAGITKWGVTKFHIVSGSTGHKSQFKNKKGQEAKNITSQEYKEVVAQTLLPEGKRLFSQQGITSWTLQQDNDPTHKKASQEAVSTWNQHNSGGNVQLLPFWPPNSPDLSPIENVWAYVQTEVNKKGCATFAEFQAEVKKTFKELPRSMLINLNNSIKDRLAACLAKNGDMTKY